MFSRELAVAATRGFRESKRGKADVHFAWLVTHLQIERWREALLWSWAVARLGGEEGMWGDDAREDLWGVLGLTGTTGPLPEEVVVIQNERTTLDDMDLMMDRNDMQFPEASEYLFSKSIREDPIFFSSLIFFSLDGRPSTPYAQQRTRSRILRILTNHLSPFWILHQFLPNISNRYVYPTYFHSARLRRLSHYGTNQRL